MIYFLDTSEIKEYENELVNDLAVALVEARNDEKWRQEYMKFSELMNEKKEEGRAEGRAVGRTEGMEEERQILNQLIICLTNNGRSEDIIKAAQNPEYQNELIKYYGLDQKKEPVEV